MCELFLAEGCVDSGGRVCGFLWKGVGWVFCMKEVCANSDGRLCGFWVKGVGILVEECVDSG